MRAAIALKQYESASGVALTIEQRDALAGVAPSITVRAMHGTSDRYELTAGSYIGAVVLDDLAIEIQPKVPIERVLFMLSYAMRREHWRDAVPHPLDSDTTLIEALIPAFVKYVRTALLPGVLQDYRMEQDALMTVRGRIRFADQVRRRFGVPIPIEVEFDDYDPDILANRLIKAALRRLRAMPIRSVDQRVLLREFDGALSGVSDAAFKPRAVPQVPITRLNQRYAPALELACMILRNTTFELRTGDVPASSVLFDMNKVFEDFVTVALRENLGLSAREFPQNASRRPLFLDGAPAPLIRLEPDLSWWNGPECIFIGDVKYKAVSGHGIVNPDIYQALAYATATRLRDVVLVYAEGERSAVHTVRTTGVRIHIVVLKLGGSPDAILAEIGELAGLVKASAAGRPATIAC